MALTIIDKFYKQEKFVKDLMTKKTKLNKADQKPYY